MSTKVIFYSDGKIELCKSIRFTSSDNIEIKVPKGFVCDGASIPRAFWHVVGHPFGAYLRQAIIHDFLYRTQPCSRKVADRIFDEALAQNIQVGRLTRFALYRGVRLFGIFAWRNNQHR